MIFIDFETYPLERVAGKAFVPPRPVGVAIKIDQAPGHYFAFDHPSGGNNCTKKDATDRLCMAYQSGHVIVGHHVGFDFEVARVHLGLEWPLVFEDTLIGAFLEWPHAASLGLKELTGARDTSVSVNAEAQLESWIRTYIPEAKKKKDWKQFLYRAPGDRVGPYAVRDVELTADLHAKVIKWRSSPAWIREHAMAHLCTQMSRTGLPIDVQTLSIRIGEWQCARDEASWWLARRLNAQPAWSSTADVIEVLKKHGLWIGTTKTSTGADSATADDVRASIPDAQVAATWIYWRKLNNVIDTFGLSWLEQARKSGRVHVDWSSTRREETTGSWARGARTGRLASSPNLQNVPKRWHVDGLPPQILPVSPSLHHAVGLPGYRIGLADYNGHELRILAHYVGGKIRDEYRKHPALDLHEFMREKLTTTMHRTINRHEAKITAFAILYGSGMTSLCRDLGVDERTGYNIKDTYIRNLPGLERLIAWTKDFERTHKRMDTWGGRSYPCQLGEDGREFGYKMLNVLIQSSAADMIKSAMLEFNTLKHPDTELILSLHDEVGIHAPDQILDDQLALLSDVMKRQALDVPLLVDQEVGRSWGEAMEENA